MNIIESKVLKNTYKSKIVEQKLPNSLFYASITNNTAQTDTISKSIDKRYVQFYFCLKGNATFHFSEHYKKVLDEGKSFLIYTPEKETHLQLSISSKSKLSLLVIDILELHNWFHSEIFESYFWDKASKIYEENPIGPLFYAVFQSIDNKPVASSISALYTETKIKELLLLYFSERMQKDSSCPYLSNEELASKIKNAKELIQGDLQNAPSSKDLAEKVDLSEYKLKEGFKKVYGKTLGQYIISQRIQRGKEILENSDKKVKKIAQEVGYDNPSHFIDAFKKNYGVTPKQYKKSLSN